MRITVIGALMIVAGAVLFVIALDQVSRKLNAIQKERSQTNKANGNDQPNNANN